jgi:hypothetical protein
MLWWLHRANFIGWFDARHAVTANAADRRCVIEF